MANAGEAATFLHFTHLVETFGVPQATAAELRLRHWGWGVVSATDAGDGLFYPGEGPLHLVLPVYEAGELVDLCAFRSADPTRWLLRTGCGWALGLEDGFERLTWREVVPLAVSPLEWLQAGADGLCVLDWDAPEIHDLLAVPHLVCSSPELANHLKRSLAKPVRFPEISVGGMDLAA